MADKPQPKSGGGCLGKLLFLILLVAACGLGAAGYFIALPQDLSDVGGYGPNAQAPAGRDMAAVLKNSIDRGYPVTLTEIEINQWLGRTLVAKQGGLLADQVKFDRVWVRLLDGVAEIVMVRSVMGQPFTVSMFVKIEQTQGLKGVGTEVQLHGGPFLESLPRPQRGGRFGQLVVPQGFLLLVLPSYQKLAELFAGEIHLVEEMARIRIEKNRLVLDPREPSGDAAGLPQTF